MYPKPKWSETKRGGKHPLGLFCCSSLASKRYYVGSLRQKRKRGWGKKKPSFVYMLSALASPQGAVYLIRR